MRSLVEMFNEGKDVIIKDPVVIMMVMLKHTIM